MSVRNRVLAAAAMLAIAGAAPSVLAQRIPDLNAPRRAAERAVDAENARLSAQTGQAVPTRRGAEMPKSGPGSTPQAGASSPAVSQYMLAPGTMQVTREIFTYEPENRRDPFFSLILTEDLRPLLSDLKLVGIAYDPTGKRSVAIMRDVLTNALYRVTTGATLGRMRVAQIRPRAVILTIDEFGLSRQDSLFLADTSKSRFR